jgi:glycosyltransferase involved in cell wall biosynthesis
MPGGLPWPCFSITTPSFNQGAYLEETIRSILLQGYPEIELVVMDGGSQDGSVEIIRKYEPWLAYWVSEADRGQSHAINKGWARATGDLIAYLNSDDFYLPSALRRAAEAWKLDPTVSMITGGVVSTDAYTHPLSEHRPFLRASSPLDLSLLLPTAWYLPQQATFFVREHLDAVERCLRETLHYTMDRELMYRICRQGRVLLIPEILAGDRHHSESKRLSKALQMYREDAVALDYCTWGDEEAFRQRRRVARWRRAQGHYHYAKRAENRLSALWHYSLAAFYRPDYLRRRGFLNSMFRNLGA